jgi:hypothetical protein
MTLAQVCSSADHIRSPFDAELPEWRTKAVVERPYRRAADVGIDEPADASGTGQATYLQYERVAARTAGEADGPTPTGGLREHEVGTSRPIREDEELRRPDDLPAPCPDEEPERRVARVDHAMRLDRQAGPIQGRDSRLDAVGGTQPPDRGSKLAVGVTDEPGSDADIRLGAWPAVKHDPPCADRDEQRGRPITR